MKIGVDISQTAYRGTGVARYTTSLLKGLLKKDSKNEYIFFFSSLRQNVPVEIMSILTKNVQMRTYKFPPSLLNVMWNSMHVLPIENLIGDVDVFFSSDWVEPPARSAKKISTIHDLVPYKFPETSSNKTNFDFKKLSVTQNIVETHKQRLEWVKKESSLITCNSNTTKRDTMEILHIPSEKIRVIYPGVDITKNEAYREDYEKKFPQDRPYILTVGTLQPRKNIQRLINAFTVANIPNIDLYIVGMQGWGNLVQNNSKNIKFLGYVSDEQLPFLYSSSFFFIYPAIYEGFGYPVIEAMKMGAAVATSNTSSLKELADGYALLFDPYSEESIAAAIHKLSIETKLRKQLQEKSIARAKDFSVEAFADGFLEIFKELS